MSVLYLTDQGSELRKTGDRLLVYSEGAQVLEIECFKVRSVLLFGGVEITTPAVNELLEHGIDLAFLSLDGRLRGRLVPPLGKNTLLRAQQYRVTTDPERGLAVASRLVSAKIANCRAILARQARNHPEIELKGPLESLRRYQEQALKQTSLESLRGVEGLAARTYFEGLAQTLRRELSFPGRRRRPPTDPVNALLSLGYALLSRELWSLCEAVGLDPYLGFYHALAYGRPSLALDILEEFRAPVVDHLVVRSTNLGQFTAADFQTEADVSAEQGLRLTPGALKRFLGLYEARMGEAVRVRGSRESLELRAAMRRQVERLVLVIERDEPYEALEIEQ